MTPLEYDPLRGSLYSRRLPVEKLASPPCTNFSANSVVGMDDNFPTTGCEFPGGGEIWPLLWIGVLVFAVWSENGSQNCNGGKCNNSAPEINEKDGSTDIIDKTCVAVRTSNYLVGWRRALIVSLLVSIIIVWMFFDKVPHGFVYFIILLLIFIPVYFSSSLIQFSHWKHRNNEIERQLRVLRSSIY